MPKTADWGWKRSKLWYSKMAPQVQPKCCWHLQHMINNWQLKKRGYLIRFGHSGAPKIFKKCHILTIFPVLGKLTHMYIYPLINEKNWSFLNMVYSVLRAPKPLVKTLVFVFAFIIVFSFAFWNANKACSVLSGLPVAWSSPTALWSVASAPWPPLGQVRVM